MASKTLIVNFVGDSKNLEQSIKRSTDQLSAFGKAGNALKNVAGYAVATAGIYGIAEAVRSVVSSTVSFQASMTRIQTQAGASADQVKKLGDGVLALSGQVGVAPTTLADGMYHVVSSLNATVAPAKRVSTELAVLKTAAEGARVGGANLVDVTNALDAAVVSGIPGTQNFQKAMGALNATVGAGDMSMQDLADAFGTGLLGPMKTFGVSLQDISAALAVFGDNNIRGQDAATKLSSAIRIMAAPSKQAAGALSTIGLSSLQLANDIRNNGLVSAFEDLKTHLTDSGKTATQQAAVITAAFGGRQSTGVNLLLNQMDRLKAKYKEVGAGANSFAGDVTQNNKTFSQEFAQVGAQLQAFGIRIGDAVLPLVTKMIPAIQSALTWVVRLFDQFKAGVGVGGQVRDILVDIGNKIAQAVTPIIKALEPEIQATVTLFTNLFDLFTSQISSSSGSTGISAATRVFAGLGTAIRVMSVPITAVMNGLSGLLGFLRQNQTVLVAVEGAVAGAAAAFVAYKVAVVATTVASTVAAAATTAFAVAQGVLEIALLATESPMLALSVAWGVLTAAMDANPLVAVVAAIGILGGALVALELKTHFLEAAWAAIKPAFQAVANWITTAAGNIVSAVTGAWDTIKTKTSSIFNSVLGFVKSYWPELLGVFTFGIGTIVGEVIQNWGTIKQKTMDVWNSITGFFQKWWPVIVGTVFGGPLGTLVALVVTHWGTIRDKTSSVFNSIKGTASNIWQAISGAITTPISNAVGTIKTAIGGLSTFLSVAWGNIKTGVTSFATSVKTGVLNAISNGINALIDFIDDVITVINKIPFVPNIKPIAHINLAGASQGAATTSSNANSGGFNNFKGGMVNRPTYMVGEEGASHPEYVLATNPAYRQRNVGLWQQAGGALGMPGFAKGGIPGYAEGGETAVVTQGAPILLGRGWNKIGASGTLGNMQQESSWNPASIGDGGGGLAGFTTPPISLADLQAFAAQQGKPWTDIPTQITFLADHTSASQISAVNTSADPGAAAVNWMNVWEHPYAPTANIPNREAGAVSAYEILTGKKIAPIFATGGASPLGSVLGSIPSTISGVATSLLEDGAKALIGQLPDVGKLPSWLKGLGGSLIGDASGYLKKKASSILSSIIGGGGGGAGPTGALGKAYGSIPAPMSGQYRDPASAGPVGLSSFDGLTVAKWIVPMLEYGQQHGWTGSITSGYRPGNDPGTATGGIGEHAGTQYPHGAVDFGGPGPLDTPSGENRAAFFRAAQNFKGFQIIPEQFPPYPQYPQGDAGHASGTGHFMGGIMGGTLDGAFAQGGVTGVEAKHLQRLAAAEKKRKPKPKPKPSAKLRGRGILSAGNAAAFGTNGPLPFDSSDLAALNSDLSAIFALDGGNGGLGIGPDGATTQLSALISTNTGNWSDDILFPPPNFGTLPDYSQFAIIPDQLADGTQPPAYLSPNVSGVSSKLGQVIGWEQGWVGDLNQTAALSKKMAKPIETAIKRRVEQIAKIRKRVEANLKKIKDLTGQITDKQGALAALKKLTPPVANPKTKAEHERNQKFEQNLSSMRSQIAGQITGLQKQITPLEAENMVLTGSKTAGGTKGELASIQTQLGVPGASASSLLAAEGGGGTSASGLYALQGNVAGFPGMINAKGGDLDVQTQALAVYKRELVDLLPQAQAAVTAANSAASTSTSLPGDTSAGTTNTTSSGGESLGDQVKDQMIEALGLRARSAEALLKAEVPIPGFATGGIPFGGWFGTGGDITASQPTLIGIGDGPGTETASIRRQGQGSGGDETHVHMHWAPGMEVFKDMVTAVVETREQGQVRNANRRLPGAGGGFTRFGR